MKVLINRSGTLVVNPETETEVYALEKWISENKNTLQKEPLELLINVDLDIR